MLRDRPPTLIEAVRDIWEDEIWGAQFITQRKVGIGDRRLAYIHRIFQLCIFIYIGLIETALLHRYAAFETPAAHINAYPAGYHALSASAPAPAYCSNANYDWGLNLSAANEALTGGYSFGPNSSCLPFSSERDITVTSNSVTFTTYVRYRPTDTSKNWTQTFFITNPEGAAINIIHAMSASFIAGGLANVRTQFKRLDGTVMRSFEAGSLLSGLTGADWLNFAGVSLDNDRMEITSAFEGGNAATWPRIRATGAVILARMSYSNRRNWELPSLHPYGDPLLEIVCQRLPFSWGFNLGITTAELVDPETGEKHTTSVSYFKTGVSVEFVVSGSVGVFNFPALLERLVEGLVLFGFATFLTEMIARCILHRWAYRDVIVSRVTAEMLAESRSRKQSRRLRHRGQNKGQGSHGHGGTSAGHDHGHGGTSGAHDHGKEGRGGHHSDIGGRQRRGSENSITSQPAISRGVSWRDEHDEHPESVRHVRSSLSLLSLHSMNDSLAPGSNDGSAVKVDIHSHPAHSHAPIIDSRDAGVVSAAIGGSAAGTLSAANATSERHNPMNDVDADFRSTALSVHGHAAATALDASMGRDTASLPGIPAETAASLMQVPPPSRPQRASLHSTHGGRASPRGIPVAGGTLDQASSPTSLAKRILAQPRAKSHHLS